jgi:hypothetical protein
MVLLLFAIDSTAEAQYIRRPWYRSPVRFGYGYGYGRFGGFTSNPVEGARYGLADVIRARGEAAESTTRAMSNYEDARSKYIDNQKKWTETYWERKRLGQAELKKDHDRKRAARERYLAQKGSGAPPRLSPTELDPSTGKIYWPETLMGNEYAAARQALDELFVLGAHTGSLRQYSADIAEQSRVMQDELKKHIRDMPANDYIAARNFLESLGYEGRQTGT